MKLTYVITIEFQDKIVNDNEINEVANNIIEGIVLKDSVCELVPYDSETSTKSISVSKDGFEIAKKTL